MEHEIKYISNTDPVHLHLWQTFKSIQQGNEYQKCINLPITMLK